MSAFDLLHLPNLTMTDSLPEYAGQHAYQSSRAVAREVWAF